MGLNGSLSKNVQVLFIESNLKCSDLAQDGSKKKNFSMWPRDCFRCILVKNVTTSSLSEESTLGYGKEIYINYTDKGSLKKVQQRLCSLVKSDK